jgi:preprotein translocase subunit YajC
MNFLFGAETACESFGAQQIVLIVVIVVLLAAVIVVPMFTNRKRQKQVADLHGSLEVGDTVTTVGGIVGTVVEVKTVSPVDKQFVLETGNETSKATLTFDINAIYLINNKQPAQGGAPAPVKDGAPAEEVFADSVRAKSDGGAPAAEVSAAPETASAEADAAEPKTAEKAPAKPARKTTKK